MVEKTIIKGLVGIGVAVLSAFGLLDFFEHRETNKKIGMSMRELKESSIKEIQQNMVESSVRSAAAEKVSEYMSRVKNEVLADARSKLADEARKAVQEASKTIRDEVSDKISSEASLIDMSELKKSARDKAEEKILSKFDTDLGDLLEKANKSISSYMDIYEGIAHAIDRRKDDDGSKGVRFTIG